MEVRFQRHSRLAVKVEWTSRGLTQGPNPSFPGLLQHRKSKRGYCAAVVSVRPNFPTCNRARCCTAALEGHWKGRRSDSYTILQDRTIVFVVQTPRNLSNVQPGGEQGLMVAEREPASKLYSTHQFFRTRAPPVSICELMAASCRSGVASIKLEPPRIDLCELPSLDHHVADSTRRCNTRHDRPHSSHRIPAVRPRVLESR